MYSKVNYGKLGKFSWNKTVEWPDMTQSMTTLSYQDLVTMGTKDAESKK